MPVVNVFIYKNGISDWKAKDFMETLKRHSDSQKKMLPGQFLFTDAMVMHLFQFLAFL